MRGGPKLLFLVLWLWTAVAAAEPTLENFERVFGAETVRGEQLGPASVAPLLTFEAIARWASPYFSFTNGIEPQYHPGARKVFRVPAFLVPEEDLKDSIARDGRARALNREMKVVRDGRTFYRTFVHPQNRELIARLAERYEADAVTWWGTPTSSSRTLYLLPEQGRAPPLMAKLALPGVTTAGHFRGIEADRIWRSVDNSAAVRRIHDETGGRLPDGTRWTFMPEVFGAVTPAHPESGFLIRQPPLGVHPEKSIVLPFLELTAVRDGEKPWIDVLFEASGRRNKGKWVWEAVVKPLLDLHLLFTLGRGLTTELHPQNALLVVNRETKAIESVGLRDTEAMIWDEYYRLKRLGLDGGPGAAPKESWEGAREFYSHWQARSNHTVHMDTVMDLARRTLPGREAVELIEQSERHLVGAFNRRFPRHRISNLRQLYPAWKAVHAELVPPEAPEEGQPPRVPPKLKEDEGRQLMAARRAELLAWYLAAPIKSVCSRIWSFASR